MELWNKVLHLVFLIGIDSVVYMLFEYMLKTTGALPGKRRNRFLLHIPYFFNVVVVVVHIGSLEFRTGVHPNYSMGIAAYTCFATLVENKDGSTGGHIKRSTAYVKLLAEEMRNRGYYKGFLTKDYIRNLCQAAPMHDIGKIAVPDVVLQKPGRLTPEEFEIIKKHTVDGGKIIGETFGTLGNEEYTEMAYQVERYHHEKWNGKGGADT